MTAALEYEFRAMNYSSRGTTDRSTADLASTYVEAALKKEFTVTVEGDLNEQELDHIEKLFRKLYNIFRYLLHLQDEACLTETPMLADRFGQLSSL